MNGYDTYKLYHAIQLHFMTDSYDFFKYKGKTKVTTNAWYARKDRFQFEILGKDNSKDALIGIFVSYFTQSPTTKPAFGNLLLEHKKTKYVDWQRDIQSLPKRFEEDMYYLKNYADKNVPKFSKMFKVNGSPHPPYVELLLNHNICYESAVVFDKLTNAMDKLDAKISEDLIWPDLFRMIKKYEPFLNIDKTKYKKILNEVFQ